MSPEEIAKEILFPLEMGNPVACLENLVILHKSGVVSPPLKTKLSSIIYERLLSQGVSPREQEEMRAFLLGSRSFSSRSKLVQGIDNLPLQRHSSPECIGTARCLFVASSLEHRFGCVHPISATMLRDGKGDIRVIVNEQKDEILKAVSVVIEAIRYYLQRRGLSPQGHNRFNAQSLSIQIGDINSSYDGTSLCLAVAVAVMSSLLEIPVDQRTAFTGTVRNTGAIEKVLGIKEKVKAAFLKEIQKVYLPQGNAAEIVQNRLNPIEVLPRQLMDDVLDEVFNAGRIKNFAASLNATEKADRGFLIQEEAETTLISTVGMRDPYGAPFNRPDELSEGAVLTAFRKLMPDRVCLIATKATEKNAIRTKELIEALADQGKCRVSCQTIEIPDPTDYDALYEAILYSLRCFRNDLMERKNYLSISSGTPQMHAVFIHLLQTGKLRAKLIQVREPRFSNSWDERVRLIESEHLGL